MLTFGGIGLTLAGIIFLLFGDKIQKDAEKAAKAKKQAPLIVLVGIAMLAGGVYLEMGSGI